MQQKVQAWYSIDLNRCLNPLFSDPSGQAGLSHPRRLIRAILFFGSRNAAYLIAAVAVIRCLERLLPIPVFIALALAGIVSVYWQVLSRDRRGQEVSPPLFLALFGVTFVLVAYLRSLADQAGFQARYDYVIGVDKVLFHGEVPTVWLQEHLYSVGRVSPLDIYCSVVYFTYFAVPLIAGVALWHLRPFGFRLYLSATLVTMCLSAAWFTLVPTAPPWLAGLDGHLPQLTRIAAAVVDNVWPGFYERNYQVVGINDVAAFPSLHVAQTLLVVLATWRYGRWMRILGPVYVASMGFSLIYLAEHYVSDVLAGVLLGGFSWAVAVKLTPSMRQAQEEDLLAPVSPTAVRESARRAA
jgi:membrane-associated phospholipid phosphatase